MLGRVYVFVGCFLSTLASPTSLDVASAPTRPNPRKADSVQVDYRFVTVELSPLVHAVSAARATPPPARKMVWVTRTHTSARPFLSRARQLVLGDGRVRPEPFPRVPSK